jgi:hypothetical protein
VGSKLNHHLPGRFLDTPSSSDSVDAVTVRDSWIGLLEQLAAPVLENLAARRLRAAMPVKPTADPRCGQVSYVEGFARLSAGMAPWLELDEPGSRRWAGLVRQGLDAISDPGSPDFAPFGAHSQALVEAAFLSHALLRAPRVLWEPLEPRVRENLLNALRASRRTKPAYCNWLLFSALVETALAFFGAPDWDPMRIDYALRAHESFYCGDGLYGDGPAFHADYYNSFVIHPMLVEIVSRVGDREDWERFRAPILHRARRYAQIQERLISPEGTFPAVGRSLAYRTGCFQALADLALRKQLPDDVSPAQVREALHAVIQRLLRAPGTFDAAGWLQIGFCGAQPEIGERYISTGSLYLCSTVFLPLGLPAPDPFWSDPPPHSPGPP